MFSFSVSTGLNQRKSQKIPSSRKHQHLRTSRTIFQEEMKLDEEDHANTRPVTTDNNCDV